LGRHESYGLFLDMLRKAEKIIRSDPMLEDGKKQVV
jgi:hypothetical protein